ncbi:5'/3'-nucleotidase SurE [Rhodobacteraceae bacterium RKSG542]|uniref:5'/3'-nucleotidase SurE n=1 Tax=Pseudovibrio flavus TaxID=2529854 RepID=UPI0012BC6DB6|nr:5'/3'-nucleotidase SurE [Pseudovibrio flavus]MTI15865.1 5'/3'-nucleotidase SurE [Pseudovibrio flavus]
MRILITNDDGIHAEGLEVLERVARQLSDDVWIVAPETDQSGVAHSLSLNDPLRLRRVSEKRYALRGTPTDCVIMGIKSILDMPPDLVLSGINRGCNIADDITYSGTVAGAMEGTLLGVRSIALSQHYRWSDMAGPDYNTAEVHAAEVLRQLLKVDLPKDTLLNVNFPAVPAKDVRGTKVVAQGKRSTDAMYVDPRRDGRGNPYYWLAFNNQKTTSPAGTDLTALEEGYISVTPLHLNLTAFELFGNLEAVLS